MPRVLIIQAEMKHYRVPFFTDLHEALREDGIELTVAYSGQNSKEAVRQDSAELPAEFGRKVKGRWFADRFLYQSVRREIASADLVIVGKENKYLINPFLLLLSVLRLKTVAFWGLGPNMDPDRSALSEWIKERMLTSVNWWFAYTQSVAHYLQEHGVPSQIITSVQNATDMRRLMKEIRNDEVIRVKKLLTGNTEGRFGLYSGLLGPIKEIPMLLEVARLVRQRCADFHLVIVGNGPDRSWLEQAISEEPWIHYMGAKFGLESALFHRVADVSLLAGRAGLAIVDSFAAGLPVMATSLPSHGPEFSYLCDYENGRITPHNSAALADAVVDALTTPTLMAKLRRGAEVAGSKYTIESMVENFRAGIKQCLARSGSASRIPVRTRQYDENNVDA